MDPEALEAKRVAVKLLADRARTRHYLQQRLEKRGLPAEAVAAALDALAEAGYVDDQQYATDRVEGILSKSLQWRPALVQVLTREGIDPDLAERTVNERLADVNQREWACEVARERLRTSNTFDTDSARRKTGAYLARRGFDTESIIAAIEEALPRP
jgi:regulatory protein